jgi:hypothetical protein
MMTKGKPVFGRFAPALYGLAAALVILGVIIIALAPGAMTRHYAVKTGRVNAGLPDTARNVDAFLVRNASGTGIGTLTITYPSALPLHVEKLLIARYTAMGGGAAWRAANKDHGVGEINVEVSSPEMSLSPAPLKYIFNNQRIAATGSDDISWVVSPSQVGQHLILVRSYITNGHATVVANPVLIHALDQKGTPTERAGRIVLKTIVATQYNISESLLSALKLGSQFVGFLLTVPGAILSYRSLKARRHRKRKGDAAS